MSKLLLLFLVLIISQVFIMLPDWEGAYMNPDPFLFHNFAIGVWLNIGGFPVSINTVSIIIFGLLILKEWMESL